MNYCNLGNRLNLVANQKLGENIMYLKNLNEKLDQFHLLNHPFYIAWNNGELNQEILQDYAEQYYQHIKAFPRYISATHSICEDIDNRKILLDKESQLGAWAILIVQQFHHYGR